jgi:hypothetical protein
MCEEIQKYIDKYSNQYPSTYEPRMMLTKPRYYM